MGAPAHRLLSGAVAPVVYKYGGTSVGSVERIKRVAVAVAAAANDGAQIVVVLSAMGDTTDKLVALAAEAAPGARGRELDALLASGEQVSTALLAMTLKHAHNVNAVSMSGAQAGVSTNAEYNKARITSIDADKIKSRLERGEIPVVAGFQGIDAEGHTTTLGRGGSDTSAVALAVALKADECRIHTDVRGVYTTDPRIVDEARLIKAMTFEEMLEMSGLGAKVLQIRAVQFAGKYNMPLRVLSSFEGGPGTLISKDDKLMEKAHVTGIAFNRDEAQLTLTGVPDTPGVAAKILGGVAAANIEVDMIVQNVGVHEGLADFTFTVHRDDYARARDILGRTVDEFGAHEVLGDDTVVKVSIVGVGMRSHAGVAATMFKALADGGINIRMISTSEIKVSVVIDEKHLEPAVRMLHKAFELESEPQA